MSARVSALRQHEASISYPDSFYVRIANNSGDRIRTTRLETHLQSLPERVRQVFREKIAQNPARALYGFQSGTVQRDYNLLGQRWKFHFYEMGPCSERVINALTTIDDTTSPLYAFCATDVEIEQIPVEATLEALAPFENRSCMGYLLDLLRAIIDFVKNCFACLCGYSQSNTVQ